MAKKTKVKTAAVKAAPTTAAKPSEVKAVIPERTFNTLVKDVKNADADIHDAQSTKSELVKKAKKSGLHVEAFRAFQKEARKSDKALSEYYTHLEHYRVIGGLVARVHAQGELLSKTPVLSEGDVAMVEGNGGRKKRASSKKKAATFESQRAREAAGEFEPGVAGEAAEAGAVH